MDKTQLGGTGEAQVQRPNIFNPGAPTLPNPIRSPPMKERAPGPILQGQHGFDPQIRRVRKGGEPPGLIEDLIDVSREPQAPLVGGKNDQGNDRIVGLSGSQNLRHGDG
jgi:hypothetical protein